MEDIDKKSRLLKIVNEEKEVLKKKADATSREKGKEN